MELPKFLKPNVKKLLLLFFIIFSPYILSTVSVFSPSLFILGWLGSAGGRILLFPFFGSACYLGFFDCNPGASPDFLIIIPVFIVLVEILFLYLISCLIADKVYTKKAAIILVLFIILLTVIPNVGTSFITVEKSTQQVARLEETYNRYLGKEYPYLKFQELTVQNNFILPSRYKLSEDTVCFRTNKGELRGEGARWYEVVNMNNITELKYIESIDPHRQYVVIINPISEKKFYLVEEFIGGNVNTEEWRKGFLEFSRNGEYLLFTNVGLNNYSYCENAKEKDIIASEKIIISE